MPAHEFNLASNVKVVDVSLDEILSSASLPVSLAGWLADEDDGCKRQFPSSC